MTNQTEEVIKKVTTAEQAILKIDTVLTEAAIDEFNNGVISQNDLSEFYETLSNWSKASQAVLSTMQRLRIETD